MHGWRRERSIANLEDDIKDLAAVQKTLQGDTDAFSDIVIRYTPVIYSLAVRLLRNNVEAEDVVQEVFLHAFRSLKSFKIEARFYSWLYTIAVNKIRSYVRREGRRVKTISLDADGAPNPPDQLENHQLRLVLLSEEERAREVISRLKPIYRIVFVLRFIEGMSLNEMSTILHVPVGTVKARLHRARKQLISILTER